MSTSSSSVVSVPSPVILTAGRPSEPSSSPHPIGDWVQQDLGIATPQRQEDLWSLIKPPVQSPPVTGPTSRPQQSPWGTCDHIEVLAPGMVRVHTAGHGGIHLDQWRIKALPPAFKRVAQAWYEEDSACSIPMVAFHREFSEHQVKGAISTLRNWYPDLYEDHFNITIPQGMSYQKDKRIFAQRHTNSLMGASAWNAGNAHDRFGIHLRDDEVLLLAYPGHSHPHLGYDNRPRSAEFVCVSSQRYDQRGQFPYVIQPDDRRLTGDDLTPAMQHLLATRT